MASTKPIVAIIVPSLLIKGGTHYQLLNLALELKKSGRAYRIYTFAYDPDTTYPEFKDLSIVSVFKVNRNGLIGRICQRLGIGREQIYLYLALLMHRRFARLLKNEPIDILNPHDWFSSWIAAEAKERYSLNAPIVVMLNDMPPSFYEKQSLKNKLLYKKDLSMHQKLTRIMVLDSVMKSKAQEYYGTIPVDIVRSGIDLDQYKNFTVDRQMIREKIGIQRNEVMLVCASIPTPHRRFEDAVESIAQLHDSRVKLVIIGDLSYHPAYGEKLKRLVKERELESKVIFIDRFLPFADRNAYISSADVFIFPNEKQTWGLGVIEAMALSVPVVVSTGAGVHEVLHDGVDALTYPVGKVTELTQALRRLMNDKNLAHSLKQAGNKLVRQNFSWSKYKIAVESVMQQAKDKM